MSILRKFLPDPPQKSENHTTRASLELMYNISRELASALDLQTVLNRVLIPVDEKRRRQQRQHHRAG